MCCVLFLSYSPTLARSPLAPRYFNGQFHLEEIMWREATGRRELNAVVRAFRDVLVCCQHATPRDAAAESTGKPAQRITVTVAA